MTHGASDHPPEEMNFGGNLPAPLQRRQRYAAVRVQSSWTNQSQCDTSLGLDSAPDAFVPLPVGPLSGFSANASSCGSGIGRIQQGMVPTDGLERVAPGFDRGAGDSSSKSAATEIAKGVPFGMPGTLGALNGTRVVGKVQRFYPGGFGFLHWYPCDSLKVKVHVPLSALIGTTRLQAEDIVEFTVFEGTKGARAEALKVVLPRATQFQLHLDNTHSPAAELEPLADQAADNEKCRQCLEECLKYKNVPSRLQAAANEYLVVIDKFVIEQESRVETDIGGKNLDGNADQLQLVRENFAKAWQILKKVEPPMTVECLTLAHAILGDGCCVGPRQFRTKSAKVGQFRPCHHTEVPSALQCYVEGLETILDRKDLSANAKSAWAGYNILAIHPFQDGNGRLSRLLINWVLKQCGSPFYAALSSSEEQRTAWREAIISGHSDDTNGQPSQPLAGIITAAATKCWIEIQQRTDRAAKSREEDAEDRALRMCRERAQTGNCSICLDDQPNTMVLCCGVSYHFSCLTRWLSTAPEPVCPTCRAAIPAPPAPASRGRNEVRVMEVGFPFDFRPGPDLVRELDMAARMVGSGLDRRWEEVLSRAGVEIQAQALCAFCPNQRAMNCTLDACARCCASTQRRYGMRCIRHPMRGVASGEVERRPRSDDAIRSESDSADEREPAASNLCMFCDNRRAADCALYACRNCCISRGQPCPRHSPSGTSSTASASMPNNVPRQAREIPPVGLSSSSSSIPAGLAADRQQASPPESGLPARRSGICSFCPNRAAMECIMHACRSCCISHGGPCAWHERSNVRTTEGEAGRDDFYHAVPTDLFSTAVQNAGNIRSQASASSSSAAVSWLESPSQMPQRPDHGQHLDEIPQTHLSHLEGRIQQATRDMSDAALDAALAVASLRGLPLSSSNRLDPGSPMIVLDDDIATRCRFCSNTMASGCIHNACRRCCTRQGGVCPRHF